MQDGRPLPLAGLRIVELADIVAGPSVGRHLGDFGAEVVKVERLDGGDAARTMGEMVGDRSAWWLLISRNKRIVALNLKHEQGREAFLRILDTADALVESYRPGVLERLALDPDLLRERNPRLVVVRISGFGQTGPNRELAGLGTLAEAYSGFASISGRADGPPTLPPIALADEVAGLFATWSLLAALYWRDTAGGTGQTIDLSLFEGLYALLGPLPTVATHLGIARERSGSRLTYAVPRNVYRTKDGHWVAVSGTAPALAERLLHAVGGEQLVRDERFATAPARRDNADELDELVAGWIATRTIAELEALFHDGGVAGTRVFTVADTLADPHFRARETLTAVADESGPGVVMQAPVPRLSETPGRIAFAGRRPDADTRAVLREVGYSEDEIAAGQRDGAWGAAETTAEA